MKRYITLSRSPDLLQIKFSVIPKTPNFGESYPIFWDTAYSKPYQQVQSIFNHPNLYNGDDCEMFIRILHALSKIFVSWSFFFFCYFRVLHQQFLSTSSHLSCWLSSLYFGVCLFCLSVQHWFFLYVFSSSKEMHISGEWRT